MKSNYINCMYREASGFITETQFIKELTFEELPMEEQVRILKDRCEWHERQEDNVKAQKEAAAEQYRVHKEREDIDFKRKARFEAVRYVASGRLTIGDSNTTDEQKFEAIYQWLIKDLV